MNHVAEERDRLFPGNSELARRMRALDWSRTSLGHPESWPANLRIALSLCLTSRIPVVMYWGTEFTVLYNDPYISFLGETKHPRYLGQPGQECWREIWDTIGPMLASVYATGQATWSEDVLMFFARRLPLEEVYVRFTFGPVLAEDGRTVEGIFCPCTETTEQVVGARRLETLRKLGVRAAEGRNVEAACHEAAAVLASNPQDIPFAAIYTVDERGEQAAMLASAGLPADGSLLPETTPLAKGDPSPWPLTPVLRTQQAVEVDLDALGRPFPGPLWPDPLRRALVLPIPGATHDHSAGLLVAGISPRRVLDDAYRTFFDLVAGHIGTAIADARAYEAERRRAEALAEIDRAKTLFFTNVSHELRTPLTLILGPVEDLLARPEDRIPAEERELLDVVHRHGLRLLKLVNTLLDFSRIEAGRLQAVYEPTDVAALTAELASVFRSAIEKAGLRLVVDCPPVDAPVFLDREMWEKIVLNLLSNAFKFTLEGEIEVRLGHAGEAVELTVRDTGTGIPARDLPHVFERFHRVEGAKGRSHEGTGIGLALVQELVKLHGGSVRVESREGQGTAFTVTVPTGSAHLPQDRVGGTRSVSSTAVSPGLYVEEALRWLPGDVSGMGEIGEIGDPGGPRPRVLLADDNADMREYVERLLRPRFDVEAVANGREALEAARARRPDLILTDVMMPELDGFGLLQKVRADPDLKETPVLMLSARAGEEARIEGVQAGADDYLVKPFSARELVARVSTHLGMARLRREASLREQALTAEAESARERLESVLVSINDQFYVLDREWRYTYLNERVAAVTGLRKEDILGKTIWELFPETLGSPFERELRRAAADQTPAHFEYRYPPWDRWFENHVYPLPEGVTVFATEVTDRKRAEEALREADRRKDEFLATLAHELRNPLAPIRNSLHILRMTGGDSRAVERVHAIMERQVSHMVRLVDDLLEISRITRGKIELRKEPVELAAILHGAVETARPMIEAAGHRLSVSLPSEPLPLEADPVRMAQVFANLLNNAAKYTEEGGQIWLTAWREGLEAVVSVRDTGVGIPADMLPRVFDMFTQLDRTQRRSQGGLGIGLTLARSLVQMHGGRVEAQSEGPGKGSELTVRLPLAGKPADRPDGEASGLETASIHSPRRILVVDDNRDAADSLGMMLRFLGSDVHVVYDGPAALDAIARYRPAVVLLDIGMPGMDGHEVARRVRQRPELRDVTLIALTGWGQEEDRRRSEAAGFDHHLVKPVAPEDLQALLSSLPAPEGSRSQEF